MVWGTKRGRASCLTPQAPGQVISMFTIKNLRVYVNGTTVVEDLSLDIREGEVHAIMGPNGAGKSSLASAIMGHPRYRVEGEVTLDNRNLLGMGIDERARAGVFLAFQHPEEIEGIGIAKLLQKATAGSEEKPDMQKMLALQREIETTAEKLGMGKDFVKRDLNVGFSGGEKKKDEVLQMMVLKPRLVVLDEIDSGLDVDGLKYVARAVEEMKDGKRSFLIITHYRRILEHVKPDRVHVLVKGRLVKSGDYTLAEEIDRKGYRQWAVGNEP